MPSEKLESQRKRSQNPRKKNIVQKGDVAYQKYRKSRRLILSGTIWRRISRSDSHMAAVELLTEQVPTLPLI